MGDEVVFLVNPASGNGSAGRRWPQIAERAEASGLRGAPLLSEGPGHIVQLATEAVRAGAKLVVVVGGDGTVNEAVNGVLAAGEDGVELALLPSGTGDDFARAFGIPSALDGALQVAAAGTPKAIDVGLARFRVGEAEADRHFANFAGAGISGAIARRGEATSRRLGARAAYFWATVAVFARWKSVRMVVEADGLRREGPMYEVLVANGVFAAGGMKVAPDAVSDDGLLEVVLIGDISKPDFLTTFPKIYRGTHVGHPKVEVLRAARVSVDAAAALPVVLDGEQPGTTPATFEIVPRALTLRVPG